MTPLASEWSHYDEQLTQAGVPSNVRVMARDFFMLGAAASIDTIDKAQDQESVRAIFAELRAYRDEIKSVIVRH